MSAKKTSNIPPQPRYVMPIIPDEILNNLINRYSLPVTKIPKDDETVMLWKHTEELKGWLSKKTNNEYSLACVNWAKIREILDAAVENNDLSLFDEFSKAWNSWDIERPQPKKAILKGKQDEKKNRLAESISELIQPTSVNAAHSPRKLDLIFAIEDIQRRQKRAPTRREIEDKADIDKNKVSDWVKEMGLCDLLSGSKRTKTNN